MIALASMQLFVVSSGRKASVVIAVVALRLVLLNLSYKWTLEYDHQAEPSNAIQTFN